MDVLLTTWDGAGNTPPVLGTARALAARGHTVRVLADPSLEADVRAAGLHFQAWKRPPARPSRGLAGDVVRDWEVADPLGSLARLRDRLAVGQADAYARDTLDEIALLRPDVLLTEMFVLGALVAAEAAGVPAVVLNPTVCIAPRPGVPPFGPGFLPAASDEDSSLHAAVAVAGEATWDEALPTLNATRAVHGLPPLDHVMEQYRSASRTLLLTSAAFDLPGDLPPAMEYVGPRLEDPAWVLPWSPPPGEDPLVLVALSSDFQDQVAVLRRVVEAVAQLPVRAVVTTGWGVAPSDVPAPAHVQVVRSAPHGLVLAHAAAVVTHAGHGTTIRSLAAGVPLVCLPMGRDQLDIAARVVHRGVGVRLDPAAAPEEVAQALRRVLEDPSFRSSAQRLAEAIAEELADDRAVVAVEEVGRDATLARA